MPKREAHDPAICERVPGHSYYHGRTSAIGGSWSAQFKCGVCSRTCRQNTNYLGQRKVICIGTKFEIRKARLKDRVAAARRLGLWPPDGHEDELRQAGLWC